MYVRAIKVYVNTKSMINDVIKIIMLDLHIEIKEYSVWDELF